MKIIKKIDDLGRIAIPKDIRRSLRWMGGDEIEIIATDNDVTLRKFNDDTIDQLYQMREKFDDDWAIVNAFNDLIDVIKDRIE